MAVRPLSEVFTARALGIAWNRYEESLGLPPYLGTSFFATNKKDGLDLKFIKGRKGLPVALKASAFDAQAPLRDGIGFSTIQNEMPFYRESYMVTEKEEQEYATFVGTANSEQANRILAEIMKNPLDLVMGANVVPERMIWQLMAPANGVPEIRVMIDGKDPYTIGYTADNGVEYKSKHYMEITTPADMWSASATATPLADIVAAKKQHRANGGEILTMFIMNETTWDYFCKAEDTKKQILGITAYNDGKRITETEIKAYMRENEGIDILVYNGQYFDETGSAKTFIPDGVVSAVSGNIQTLGTIWYGTTPEERSGNLSTGSLSMVNTGVALYTYTTPHPLQTHCVCSEIVLPSYENMDSVFVMKVA